MRRILYICAAFALGACGASQTSSPDMQVILADKPAPRLAAYNLFDDNGQARERVTSYDLINPLFTDYADKQRHVFVPKEKQIVFYETETFGFPVGTVLVKSFGYGEGAAAYKIETRLLIHKKDGWAAYPYVWNDAQTEAVYAPAGKKLQVKTVGPSGEALEFTYVVPNANQCKTCHQSGHDITPIGPKARNLGLQQVSGWQEKNILSDASGLYETVPDVDDATQPLDGRARAYLDINCAHCHKETGSASNSGLWLEWGETSSTRRGIRKHPTAAGRGAGGFKYVIDPGRPETSILSYRMASTQAGIAMPELGRSLADAEGVALIDEWIASMPLSSEE